MSSHTKEQFDKITGNKEKEKEVMSRVHDAVRKERKEKAEELEREIKRLVDYGDKQEYYKQDVLKAELKGLRDGREGVIKYDEGYCYNCKKAIREGVIKEIEKNMLIDEEGDIFISKRVWECFKHNPFAKSVIIGKTKGGKRK